MRFVFNLFLKSLQCNLLKKLLAPSRRAIFDPRPEILVLGIKHKDTNRDSAVDTIHVKTLMRLWPHLTLKLCLHVYYLGHDRSLPVTSDLHTQFALPTQIQLALTGHGLHASLPYNLSTYSLPEYIYVRKVYLNSHIHDVPLSQGEHILHST